MNIRTMQRLATGVSLAVIGLIALAVGWNHAEVSDARREREQANAIVQSFAGAVGVGNRAGRDAQPDGRLLVDQQESLADAFRLAALATERIALAERWQMSVIFAGLVLITLVACGEWWFVERRVLVPVVRLQRVTKEIAAGNLNLNPGVDGDDEIGSLAKDFDAMTRSLRASFASIESANRELAAANQELEAFSYSVSHDLRAPLRSIDGFSLILAEDYGDRLDEEGLDALARVRAAAQLMGRLIDDMLRLSKVTRSELELAPIDLSAMTREIADDLEQESPGRAVDWVIEPGLRIHADAALMRIALQNLLQNAWKFTCRTPRPRIRVGAQRRDGRIVVCVADNGAGFDMAYAKRLFGAFQRLHTEDEYPGTGIGLAIVQRIIRRHGGKVWGEARPGEGAAFFFYLAETGNGTDCPAD